MLIYSPKELAIFAVNQRKKLGLTQAEVADRVGLKQKTISAFETKPESVMLLTTFRILSALNIELQFFSQTDPARKTPWSEPW